MRSHKKPGSFTSVLSQNFHGRFQVNLRVGVYIWTNHLSLGNGFCHWLGFGRWPALNWSEEGVSHSYGMAPMVTIRIREEQFLVRRCLVGIYFRAHKDPEWNEGKKSLTVCLENHLTFEIFFFLWLSQHIMFGLIGHLPYFFLLNYKCFEVLDFFVVIVAHLSMRDSLPSL